MDKYAKVYIRIKPSDRFSSETFNLLPDEKSLNVNIRKEKENGYIDNQVREWNFKTCGILHNASQNIVYEKCAAPLVSKYLDGYSCTLFAYGQTGSGKTYTITGSCHNFQQRGLVPRTISQLYKEINERHEQEISVKISYLKIYKETVYDLLVPIKSESQVDELILTVNEHGETYVKGLSLHDAATEEIALSILFEGELNRRTRQFEKNENKSHYIFTILIKTRQIQTNSKFLISKFNFVDLAGSERIKKYPFETQSQTVKVNKSLSFFEQTVRALSERSRLHIPFRQTKLTHLLQDSLGGKFEIVMIGNIQGERENIEESLSTLRFACRVMKIPTQPVINFSVDPTYLCNQYKNEISLLKKELAAYDTLADKSDINYLSFTDSEINDIHQQVLKYISFDVEKINFVNLKQINEILVQFRDIVNQTEARVEKRLQEKYAPKEKKENCEKNIEPINTPEKGSLVGEKEANSFSIGRPGTFVKPAMSPAIVNLKKKNKKTKENAEGEHHLTPNPLLSSISVKMEPSIHNFIQDIPPSKNEAYETFKHKAGDALYKALIENKDCLSKIVCKERDISTVMNKSLQEIEQLNSNLKVLKDANEEIFQNGIVVLGEVQFDTLNKLHSLKKEYRSNYKHLQNLRVDKINLENVIKRCRQKLLNEFEFWYKESFGIAEQNSKDKKQTSCFSVNDDRGACFEKAEKTLLMKSPESAAFYSARLQTDRRKLAEQFFETKQT
ncbi:kinesin-like protein KIF9 [Hydra vulgaris]|uniref:kinesin-like protein KIF9 n=1 Tax=Hydra vulgaris TaxID=6087 RepID=UPI001F5ECD32|nr:kinesin-like protein KIF9 [Hydra vulgaris]